MSKMLRHKKTGELFIYTSMLATNPDLEIAPDTAIENTVAEVLAEQAEAEMVESEGVLNPIVEPTAEAEAVTEMAPAQAPAKPAGKKKAV